MPDLKIKKLGETIKIESITLEDLKNIQERCVYLFRIIDGVELSENQVKIKSLLEKVQSYGDEKIEELNKQSITNLEDIIQSMSDDDCKYFAASYKLASQNPGFSGIHFRILPIISDMMELEEFASAKMAKSPTEPKNYVNLTLHDQFYNSYFDIYPLRIEEDAFKSITLTMLHEFSHIHDNNNFISSKNDSIAAGNNVLNSILDSQKMYVLKESLEIVDPLYPFPAGNNVQERAFLEILACTIESIARYKGEFLNILVSRINYSIVKQESVELVQEIYKNYYENNHELREFLAVNPEQFNDIKQKSKPLCQDYSSDFDSVNSDSSDKEKQNGIADESKSSSEKYSDRFESPPVSDEEKLSEDIRPTSAHSKKDINDSWENLIKGAKGKPKENPGRY